MLSEREKAVVDWYNQNAAIWAGQRKKVTEPSFWQAEYEVFKSLQKPSGKLLEIGSGSGREAIEFLGMGYDYFGIDSSYKLLEIARQRAPLGHYFQTSVYEMPFVPHTFDAFSSWAILPHIPKARIEEVLLGIKNVVKAGGLGFIAMREGDGEQRETNTGRWFSYYQQEEFVSILQNCRFEIVEKGKKVSRPDLTWLTFFVRT
jgi:ubiquinone/menaquinone biosynthesis C-methylase UbiE